MNAKLDRAASYVARTDLVESRLGDETVILHLTRGIYFGLDAVGTLIWERLRAEDKPTAIASFIAANFEAAPEMADNDVMAFLEQLLENELIVPR